MSHRLFVVESAGTEDFGPLTHFRASFELLCGILPLWRKFQLQYEVKEVRLLCRDALAGSLRRRAAGMPVNEWGSAPALLLDGRIIADPHLPGRIPIDGSDDVVFVQNGAPIGARLGAAALGKLAGVPFPELFEEAAERWPHESVEGVHLAHWPWDLVQHNTVELMDDFALLRSSDSEALHEGKIDHGVWMECPQRIHIGHGAHVHAGAVLDAESGPIYIADRATIMPGAVVIGPAAIGEGSSLKIHAKIYPGTTIGPVCKIGGEVEDSIVHGFSNKQHDGFLGHAYLGEWINIGAGTNNSDLKNNYGHVRVKIAGHEVDTGSQFVGLFVGDHSKCGIGTTFNTGTVVGSCCNIFGPGLPPKAIPSFAWGGAGGFVGYDLDRCLGVAREVMRRRNVQLAPDDERLIRDLYGTTAEERHAAGILDNSDAMSSVS